MERPKKRGARRLGGSAPDTRKWNDTSHLAWATSGHRAYDPSTLETSAPTARRSDARRNRETVIDAAIRLLNLSPDASMAEIAAESGLARTTVYRHFPNREDLLVALFGRVIEDSRVATDALTAEARSAEDLLRKLAPRMIEIGLRYRFLHVPARLVHSARRRQLRIPESWPWVTAIVAVFANIAAIPQPA